MSLTKTILVNTWVVLFFVSIDKGVKEPNCFIICSLLIFQGWKVGKEMLSLGGIFLNSPIQLSL